MTPDYPAAHSMDTDWFAVDRDGHVAHFHTGPDGAAPVDTGSSGGDLFAVEETLRNVPSVGEPLLDPDGLRNNAWTPHYGAEPRSEPVVILLPRTADLTGLPLPSGTRTLRATSGIALLVPRMTRRLAKSLHHDGLCAGCVEPPIHHFDAERVDLVARGLFTYDPFGLAIAGPYGREQLPAAARVVDELPAALRPLVSQNVFPSLCFLEQPLIQPVTHFKCRTWTGIWLDGRVIRFMPGEADRWKTLNYALLRQSWEAAGFTVAPAPPETNVD